MELDTIVCADALEYIKTLPDASVDAVITDPPYGTTAIEWDKAFDLQAWWKEVKRITKPHSPVVMFGSQPFTSVLVCSNLKQFRHEWIWSKNRATGHLNAKKAPLKAHENIVVFSQSLMTYNPIFERGDPYVKTNTPPPYSRDKKLGKFSYSSDGRRYPRSIIIQGIINYPDHPTEKPLALMRYLVETYSQPGDVILDPFAGSGTTLVAAQQLGRHYIGCDLSAEYVEMARKRLDLPFTMPMFDGAL